MFCFLQYKPAAFHGMARIERLSFDIIDDITILKQFVSLVSLGGAMPDLIKFYFLLKGIIVNE
jgi:hypothetical protein